MRAIEAGVRLTLKNILLLTDFSEPSELAVPFATAIAREYESKLYAMHVLTPLPLGYATPESAAAALEGLEEGAQAGMQRLDAQLVGVPHETMLVRGESVWPSVEQALGECEIDRANFTFYPRGPRSGPGFSVPVHPRLTDPVRPT
jgi:nucleotide-binding universal stress UspA family protein